MSDISNQPFTIVAPGGGDTDWCSEIPYTQVELSHVQNYMQRNLHHGFCFPPAFFFGLHGRKGAFPIPTDVGVPKGLPALPLGFHYPQLSTDSKYGRALQGRFAIERGTIIVAPWIQSNEAVLISWDGIKLTWVDGDPIDSSPMLLKAVAAYVLADHQSKFERDYTAAAAAQAEFVDTRREMMYDCREQTRVREREGSVARGSSPTALFYNTEQSFTAQCADGTTGSSVTVTIPAGTVGSVRSVADANQQALDEAKSQATGRLDCTTNQETFTNDQIQSTVYCTSDSDHPTPDGNPITVIIQAGTYSASTKAEANAKAQAAADSQASSQLIGHCTWWNKEVSYTAVCDADATKNVTKTIGAKAYSSTQSQDDADTKAMQAAKNAANTELESVCPATTLFWNAEILRSKGLSGCGAHGPIYIAGILAEPADPGCNVIVNVTVPAHSFSNTSQNAANQDAINYANNYALNYALNLCRTRQCGTYNITLL